MTMTMKELLEEEMMDEGKHFSSEIEDLEKVKVLLQGFNTNL